MSIFLEYEKHILISKKEYNKLLNYYLLNCKNSKFLVNQNIYYDSDNKIINNNAVLRIRTINYCNNELTFKTKSKNANKEINIIINKDEIYDINRSGIIQNKTINKALKKIGVIKVYKIASLKTLRYEFYFQDSTIVIDKNFYCGKIDYDIEIESNNMQKSNEILKNIIDKFKISSNKNNISKSQRAYKYAKNIN